MTRGDDFDEFVRGSATRLLRTAVLLTGDRAAAEDLVQEMFERVYVKWRRIRSSVRNGPRSSRSLRGDPLTLGLGPIDDQSAIPV